MASQINAGNVLLRAPWNDPFKDECRMFPFDKYDDQVDAAARGFNQFLYPHVGIFT